MAELEVEKQEKKADAQSGKEAKPELNLLDLKEKAGGLEINRSPLLVAGREMPQGFLPMNNYILEVQEQEKDQSYFKAAATFLTRAGRSVIGMDDTSSKFEKAMKDGNEGIMYQLYDADQKQRAFENNFANYSAAILKTGFLFASGKVGWGGLTAVMASDQAKPADSVQKQMADAILGAGKGLATRFVFNKLNETTWNPVSKGWVFGASSRLIDVGLTSNHYLDKEGNLTGDSFKGGLQKTFMSVAGPEALIADAGTAAISHLTLLPANYFMGGAYFKNALASKLTMAGVAGLTNGSLRELNRQQDQLPKPEIDWKKVAEKGLERGALDTISALPGARFYRP